MAPIKTYSFVHSINHLLYNYYVPDTVFDTKDSKINF